MQLCNRPAASGLARSRGATKPAGLPAFSRPVVVRRFKDDDGRDINRTVEQAKDRLQSSLKDGVPDAVKGDLQQGVKPTDYDAQFKVNPGKPAFTRRREVFVGRLAILGIVAAGFWETVLPNHPNILQQVSMGLGLANINLGPGVVLSTILGSIVYSGLVALAPGSPTFDEENKQDVAKRPGGPANKKDGPNNAGEILGISGWGFTKKNELFNGRMAMLGFTAGIMNQLLLGGLNGPGPLAQVAAYLRIPADESFYGSVPIYFIGFTILATALAYFRGATGEKTRFGERDIY